MDCRLIGLFYYQIIGAKPVEKEIMLIRNLCGFISNETG
jgi:hypothetical protein